MGGLSGMVKSPYRSENVSVSPLKRLMNRERSMLVDFQQLKLSSSHLAAHPLLLHSLREYEISVSVSYVLVPSYCLNSGRFKKNLHKK